MNREIKFRGKCERSDEWCYGSLVDYGYDEMPEIQGFDVFREGNDNWKEIKVNPETVGQFTGLYDKNGKEIYEGDIILEDKDPTIMEIVFRDGIFFASIGNTHGENRFMNCALRVILDRRKTHIIGNIHDNPGLLKGDEK